MRSTTTPETTGVAIDVPDFKANPLTLDVAASMFTPGAAISGCINRKPVIKLLQNRVFCNIYVVRIVARYTLRIAGEIELGPLDEKVATFVATGCPTSVLEACIFTMGDLAKQNSLMFTIHGSVG